VFSKIVLGRARPRRDIARVAGRAPAGPRRPCPARLPNTSLPEAARHPKPHLATRLLARGASNRGAEAPYTRRARDGPLVRPQRRPCAGRGAVAQRNPPSSPRRHPESARIKGRRIFPQSRCPAVLPHPPPATIRAAAETLASLTPGVVRVAWHLP
jgi:hypothetical protein